MQVHVLVWAALASLSGDGHISALSQSDATKDATRIPKIRHKSFSFDDDDISVSDSIELNGDIDHDDQINNNKHQSPKVQHSRSRGKPKSILEKLVREPELGKNASVWNILKYFAKTLSTINQKLNTIKSNDLSERLHFYCFVFVVPGSQDSEIELAAFNVSPTLCPSQSASSQYKLGPSSNSNINFYTS